MRLIGTSAETLLCKYPDRVPLIAVQGNKSAPQLNRCKFLVPRDYNFGQFVFFLRKTLEMDPSKALFCFVNGKMLSTSTTMMSVYNSEKDYDGFLRVHYQLENTFGGQTWN